MDPHNAQILLQAIEREIHNPDKDLCYDDDEGGKGSDLLGEFYLALRPLHPGGIKISVGGEPINIPRQLAGAGLDNLFEVIFENPHNSARNILVAVMNASLRKIPVIVELADREAVLAALEGIGRSRQLDSLEVRLLCRWHREIEPSIEGHVLLELLGDEAMARIKASVAWLGLPGKQTCVRGG